MIEPVEHFLTKAKESLSEPGSSCRVNFLLLPLQELEVKANRYDVVWIQWCIGHLTDDDCVEFLKTCARSLKPNGMILVKENNARRGFVLDKEDSSITRSDSYLVEVSFFFSFSLFFLIWFDLYSTTCLSIYLSVRMSSDLKTSLTRAVNINYD